MSGFISLITSVLSIPLSLGTLDTNIGSVLVFILLLRYAFVTFFNRLATNADLDRRARSHGFNSWKEYNSYENYMAGGDRHKDGKYY